MTDDLDPDMIATLAEMMEAQAVKANSSIVEVCKELEREGVPAPARIHALLSAAFAHLYDQCGRDTDEAAAALNRLAKSVGEAGIRDLTPLDNSWQ